MKKLSKAQLVRIESVFIIIKNTIDDLIRLRKENIPLFKGVTSSLRSQIFDNSFFDTGLISESAIELKNIIKNMTKEEKKINNIAKNDNFKFVKEHPVNRVVISALLLDEMMNKRIVTLEEYINFISKYNVTITITKLEHNNLSGTTGYYIKTIDDYRNRNIFVENLDFLIEDIQINSDVVEFYKKLGN